MPDISHKDAGFIVLVAVLFMAIVIVFTIIRISKYYDRKEPKNLRALSDKINLNHKDAKFTRSLSFALTYLKYIESNPMQHMEIGPVFALIAKTHLRMQQPTKAYYYSRISEYYYGLFDVVTQGEDGDMVLMGNLRLENEKTETQSGLLLDATRQTEIRDKINSHQANASIRGSADWIRLSP